MSIFLCRPYYCYFPFSLGPRSCIGQVFAQVSRGLEQHLGSKHWASSGCGDHGWWWAPEATLMPCALPLFSSEGRSPPMPMTGVSHHCCHKSRHPCSRGVCREEQQAPSKCPGPACSNPNPLVGITVNILLPAKVKHTHPGDVQGVLGVISWLPLTQSRQGKHQLEEDTSQNWPREGEGRSTWTEGTI